MTRYEPGDVVLVRFPFTDLTSTKRRPAVVVSPAEYASRHGDVVALALTSQDPGDAELQLKDWRQAGLPKPTWFKPVLATLSGGVIHRRLGRLAEDDRRVAAKAVSRSIDDAFRAF